MSHKNKNRKNQPGKGPQEGRESENPKGSKTQQLFEKNRHACFFSASVCVSPLLSSPPRSLCPDTHEENQSSPVISSLPPPTHTRSLPLSFFHFLAGPASSPSKNERAWDFSPPPAPVPGAAVAAAAALLCRVYVCSVKGSKQWDVSRPRSFPRRWSIRP